MPIEPIKTLESLQEHLWDAAKVEFSTIPLYLYTMYSLKVGKDYARQDKMTPLSVFRGVVIEEMLHLSLVRNMYIAVGGSKPEHRVRALNFYDKAMMPVYPSPMLMRAPELMLTLKRYSRAHVKDVFMEVELPDEMAIPKSRAAAKSNAVYATLGDFYAAVAAKLPLNEAAGKAKDPERRVHLHEAAKSAQTAGANANANAESELARRIGAGETYNTLGQFYQALMAGFQYLSNAGADLFANNNFNFQLMSWIYYIDPDGGGSLLRVGDLDGALSACCQIMDQGEGHSGAPWVTMSYQDKEPYAVADSGFESSHYYKFAQMGEGVYEVPDSEVWPVMENPKAHMFPEHVRELSDLFNACYCFLMAGFDQIFNTPNVGDEKPPKMLPAKWQLMQSVLAQMSGLLYHLASVLMSTPVADGLNAGPTFEFYEFDRATPPREQVQRLYAQVESKWPVLKELGVNKMIALLPDIELQPE